MTIRLPARYVIRTIVAFFVALLLVFGVFSFFQPQDMSLTVRDFFGIDDKPEQVANRLCKAVRDNKLPDFLSCCSMDAIHRYQLQRSLLNGDNRPVEQMLNDYMASHRKKWKNCKIEVEQAVYVRNETGETATVMIHLVEKKGKGKSLFDRNLCFVRNKATHRWECIDELL